jgi:uncharacterized phage protein gp47/JayE
MSLQTKTFTQFVSDQVAAIQGAAAGLIDFAEGSILRAVSEAVALVALWLESLVVQVLRMTRASTSVGDDLDSWVADFGLTRASAALAQGVVTFARFTSTTAATVPVGAQVRTADGAMVFEVIADLTNNAYDAGALVYRMAIGVASVDVRVRALTVGTSGNVQPGAVNTIMSSITGVDTVTNAQAFSGGGAAETDAALRARFVAYLASLSQATHGAIAYAINSVQPGLSHFIIDGADVDGTPHPAFFYVVVDDGSGAPSAGLIEDIAAAIEERRAVGVTYGVVGPTVLFASVVLTVTVNLGYDAAAVRAAAVTAIEDFITSLGVGKTLHISRLVQLAYDATPGAVSNVTNVSINSGGVDLVPTPVQVVRTSLVTVN